MSNREMSPYRAAMEDLRKGNRSHPIPARKPLKRGGRSGAKNSAIKESRNG